MSSPRRQRFHSTMLPPPSIVASVYSMAPTSMHSSALHPSATSAYSPPRHQTPTPLVALQRKERSLQHHLQSLLDAQSAGLLAGLEGGGGHTDASSEGSSTPTAASMAGGGMRSSRVVPVGQPRARKPLSLRGARRGILVAMQEFAGVKSEEAEILDGEVAGLEEVRKQVDAWETKQSGLRERIEGIEAEEGGSKVNELRNEAGRVEAEIVDLENRVMELKGRHRRLLEEAEELESSVQAKLSSYKASLSIVDNQVLQFLTRPPSSITVATSRTAAAGKADETTFLRLPPRRRTLEMAESYLKGKRKELARQRTAAEVERDALEDGAVVWEDVVNEVTSFERKLRVEMRALGRPPIASLPPETSRSNFKQRGPSGSGQDRASNNGAAAEGMRAILRDMDNVILQLESKLKLAEARGWRLLVCCVGAELEAFREGKILLEDTLRAAGLMEIKEGHMDEIGGGNDGFDPLGVHGGPADGQNLDHGLRELDDHNHGLGELRERRVERSPGSEDEGPDPTLLMLHQEDVMEFSR